MAGKHDLQGIRERIERVDHDILALLKQRMELVEAVARAKIETAAPFRDAQREEHVLQRVRHLAVELGLDAHAVEHLYRQIMEMSISHQQAFIHALEDAPLRVAYQGVEGAYSHLAAQRRYAGRTGGVLLTGYETFQGAVHAVREGEVDLALLPIENTTAGSVSDTVDLLAEGGIVITAEVVHRVEHCLLAIPGTALEAIRTVISHPQALAQCATFLHGLANVRARGEFDTAGAARKVAHEADPTLAAIASESAAAMYGLAVLRRGIQSHPENATRFVEVAREAAPCAPDVPCKTSLMLVLSHRPGALGEVLACLSAHAVNLTKIESRPIAGRAWQYRFYLDVEGHAASPAVHAALAAVTALVSDLRVLGTYPQADPAGS